MPPQIQPITNNKMQSRDHQFNRSTRPLLDRRPQPQVVSSKNMNNNANKKQTSTTRGFNDFNLITRQYENLNSNKGYPYGSPPSPNNVNDSDFIFSDNNHASQINFYNNSDEDEIGGKVLSRNQINIRRRIVDATDYSTPTQVIGLPIDTTNEGPFVFGLHTHNTFTPSYEKTTKYTESDNNNGSPNSSQNQSDISSSSRSTEKDRRSLVKEKKSTKRTKKDPNEKKKQHSKEPPNVKCVLVGDGAVGKTNLIVSYIQDRFAPEYIPTAFDKYNVDVSVNGRPICVTLCDTAGQDALDPLRQLCYPRSHVFLLCFSVVKPETFRSVASKWEPEIAKLKASVVLVGTQSDLRIDRNTISKLQAQGEKPVAVSDAWDFARTIGAKYIETSSNRKERIKEVFDTAIWDALQSIQATKRPLWKRMLCLA